jgi:methionyl-tRNA formyltransferase
VRILFLGYQSIGHEGLSYLKDEVTAVVTHRDAPGETIWWKSVADLGRAEGLPVHYDEELEPAVDRYRPDLLLSFYYRHMVPARILSKIPRGGLNMHGSFLPRYRGRAPANWVLVNDEPYTGMTLHEMTRRADSGPIVDQEKVVIDPRETIATLYPKLIRATRVVLERAWPLIREGRERRTPQDESMASTFGGRRPEDGEIHWEWPARRIDCLVRAVTRPYPGAFVRWRGRKLLIWQGVPAEGSGAPGTLLRPGVFACGQGAFEIERAQFEGGRETGGKEIA